MHLEFMFDLWLDKEGSALRDYVAKLCEEGQEG